MKQKLALILAFIAYWTGIIELFYKLNKNKKRIITFHNVIPKSLMPSNCEIGLEDTEETFRFKIREIKKKFKIDTDIENQRTATITFDDGYKNQVIIAGEILNEEGSIPAIIFASGKLIDNNSEYDALIVDLLLHWTFMVPNGSYKVKLKDSAINLNLNNNNRQEIWEKYIWKEFRKDINSKGAKLLSSLNGCVPLQKILSTCSDEYINLRLRGISTFDIDRLTAKGWIIGWHTMNHYPLSLLSKQSKIFEISESAPSYMKNRIFSYPYGEYTSVDNECMEIAESAGYPCAVSNLQEPGNNPKFFRSRITLPNNFYLLHFELSGLKFFITKHKLLPHV